MFTANRNLTIVILLIVLAAATATAQDFIFTNFQWGYQSHVIGDVSQECGGAWNVQSASMAEYDTSALVSILCKDGRLHARRYMHQNDQVRRSLKPQPQSAPVPQPVPYDDGGQVVVVPPAAVTPTPVCDSTNRNFNGTGMTECAWRRRWAQ